MTGLTGLDVDGLVYQLMRVERLKVDAVSRNRQLLVWKQEQYREIISALQSFTNEFFNTLKPATDMRVPAFTMRSPSSMTDRTRTRISVFRQSQAQRPAIIS